jgi:hypothetical protein
MSEWKLVPVEPTDEMLNAANGCPPNFPEGRVWVDQDNATTYRAMLDAAPQPPSQWPQPRPMSEAPKDVPVLAWWPASNEWVATWWWSGHGMWIHLLSGFDEQPTCWLPMPAAPAEQEVTP